MLAVHGRWKIKVFNNVLIQWFADSWNEEAIIKHVKEFKRAAEPLLGKQWAIISVFEQWELGIPAIESHVTEACEWFKLHGCIRDCHVYTPSSLKEMQLEKMIPRSEANYKLCVFDNIETAIAWLEDEGFHLNEKEVRSEHKLFLKGTA